MIKWMKLRNLALVEEAEVEFGSGFNAITGETGAGKSVIMGAVGLLLGERADHSAIRNGCDKCEISAEFQIPDYAVDRIHALLELEDAAGDDASALLIRRTITKTGSRNFINGSAVTLNTLAALGHLLIDVHAANSSQSLMSGTEQLVILDRFGKHDALQNECRKAWGELSELRNRQEEFLKTMPSADEAERLRRDAEEIRRANPVSGEDAELSKKHELASHSRSIMEQSYAAEQGLTGDEGSVLSLIGDIRRTLSDLERFDPAHGAEFLSRIEDAADQISSLSGDIVSYASSVEVDEAEFQAMETRLQVLQTLKRRYGPALDDVLAYLEKTEDRIHAFENTEMIREDYREKEQEKLQVWKTAAEKLSAKRRETAKKLVHALSAEAIKLGFLQAEFDMKFSNAAPGANGQDAVCLLFSANPGSPLCPLKEVASSGELSRIMLAAKTVLAEADSIPVLIFDEIDANIGGETAWTVGDELSELAKHKQVICISHLAQVARAAGSHFLVSKSTENGIAVTRIHPLEKKERIAELARMLGGGKAALEHAKEIMKQK